MTTERVRKILKAFIWGAVGFVVTFLIVTAILSYKNTPYYDVTMLDEDWIVTEADGTQKEVTLANAETYRVPAGQKVELVSMMPDRTVPQATLRIYTIRVAIDVYLEDRLIYSYGHDVLIDNFRLTYGYRWITLPDNYNGKQLRVVVQARDVPAFTGIKIVHVGNRRDLYTEWFVRTLPAFFAACFAGVFGIQLLIQATYMYMFHHRDFRIWTAAILNLNIGIYILASNDYVSTMFDSDMANMLIEYHTYFFMAIAVSLFMYSVCQGIAKKIFLAMFTIDIIGYITIFAIYYQRKMHISYFIVPIQPIIISEGLIGTVILLSYVFKRQRAMRSMTIENTLYSIRYYADLVLGIGCFSIIMGAVLDVMLYNARYIVGSKGSYLAELQIFPATVMIFILCLFLNYFLMSVDHANEEAMQEDLERIAYNDSLTGLANRTQCEQRMEELNSVDYDYTIFSIDIHKLKEINDTFGHARGDELLKGFSDVLRDSFREFDLMGRMGGDEFIVIIRNLEPDGIEERIKNLLDKLEKASRKSDIEYEAAIGAACSNELPDANTHGVYMLADERMYAMKTKMHEAEKAFENNKA